MQKKVLIGYSIVSPLHLINFLTFLNGNKNNFDKVYVFLASTGVILLFQKDMCNIVKIKI
jgi:hypothetical protein